MLHQEAKLRFFKRPGFTIGTFALLALFLPPQAALANHNTTGHTGVDILTTLGEAVVSPVDGIYVRPERPYRNDLGYSGVYIRTDDGFEVKVFFIEVAPDLKPGDRVEAGKTPIGTAQDITLKYPPTAEKKMANHIHVQIKKDGKAIDPTGPITGQK